MQNKPHIERLAVGIFRDQIQQSAVNCNRTWMRLLREIPSITKWRMSCQFQLERVGSGSWLGSIFGSKDEKLLR